MTEYAAQLRLQRMGRADLETFTAWFADAELSRRISVPTELWFRHVSAQPGNFAWLAYEGGRAIGQVQMDTYPDRTGSVSLVVNPGLRGRGYGKRILRLLLAQPEAARLDEIEACIEADNPASLRCFRACGFVARGAGPDSHGLIAHTHKREAAPDTDCPAV